MRSARARGARDRVPSRRDRSRARRGGSPGPGFRVAAREGALLRWLQPKLGERRGGGGAERSAGPEPRAPWEASWAAGGEPPAAALEKAGSGGVATRRPRPPLRRAAPGPGAERGRGGGEQGSGGGLGGRSVCVCVSALHATTLARSRDGAEKGTGHPVEPVQSRRAGVQGEKRMGHGKATGTG